MSFAAFADALAERTRVVAGPVGVAHIGRSVLSAIRADILASHTAREVLDFEYLAKIANDPPPPAGEYIGTLFGVECYAQDAEGIRFADEH
jgi:hypothetical protein